MQFEVLDTRMRVFETAYDLCVLPGLFMVARLDGRSFTRLTKETHAFVAPFDARFRDSMLATTAHLMQCGFRVIYGYTQSDEISLLFHPDEATFDRKLRKYLSILAGEASAQCSLLLGSRAAFDCRISQLPTAENVIDYFRWRSEDAHRNALNGHCYWMLRNHGMSSTEATTRVSGLSVAEKNELLFSGGINVNDLPPWQKRGCGLYWMRYRKTGHNPITGTMVEVERRQLHTDLALPMKEQYAALLHELLAHGECVSTNRRGEEAQP